MTSWPAFSLLGYKPSPEAAMARNLLLFNLEKVKPAKSVSERDDCPVLERDQFANRFAYPSRVGADGKIDLPTGRIGAAGVSGTD